MEGFDLQKAVAAYQEGIKSGLLTKDWNTSTGQAGTPGGTGLQQYNLLPFVPTLQPLVTPLLNVMPRLQGKGRQAEFKAIINITGATRSNIWAAEGTSGPKVDGTVMDALAVYKGIKLSTGVTIEQQFEGAGLLDTRAVAVVNLLREFRRQEEIAVLGAANSTAAANQFAGGAFGSGTIATGAASNNPAAGTACSSGTGGTLASGVWGVQISANTIMGESNVSAVVNLATQSANTQQIFATAPARTSIPVTSWNLYLTSPASTVYKATWNGGTINVTSTTAAGQYYNGSAVSGAVNLTVATGTAPSGDASASANAYNGLLTTCFGSNYTSGQTWAGVGLGKPGSTLLEASGQSLSYAGTGNNSITTLFNNMFTNALAAPEWLLVNAQDSLKVSNLTFGGGAPYYVVPEGGQNEGLAGFRASRLVNQVTGDEVRVKVHPSLPQGTLVAGTNSFPDWYIGNQIPAVAAIDAVQDYTEIDYPLTYNTSSGGDTWIVEIMNLTTFKMFLPALFGVLSGVSQG